MTTPDLAALSLSHLQAVVAIDSASDERSSAVPTTPGQTELADMLAGFFGEIEGAQVERDAFSNVLCTLPGRGSGQDKAPVALMIHLDTARGTHPVSSLVVSDPWRGDAVAYPKASRLRVDLENYPSLSCYLDQRLVHGPGDAPFGLDDKLGLAHAMTLFKALEQLPEVDHPPLIFVGRPDEEVGRVEALLALSKTLAERGVKLGYTLDGLDPFEVNVENFDAAGGWIRFVGDGTVHPGQGFTLRLGGVNTHGATAKAEGHRSALRFAAEIRQRVQEEGVRAHFSGFSSDPERDCDAVCILAVDPADEERLWQLALEVVSPHRSRGASVELAMGGDPPPEHGVDQALQWVSDFYASDPGFVLYAEESEGRQGYTACYRARPHGPSGLQVDIRIRDFGPERRKARIDHIERMAGDQPWEWTLQYDNMGRHLAECPELVDHAMAAAKAAGVQAKVQPIRGGTGIDPFLKEGVMVANLGTGYFAPESEKELTSMETMAGHARWLLALVQELAK